jgi:tetratricopeptide (TPR) repeat protein
MSSLFNRVAVAALLLSAAACGAGDPLNDDVVASALPGGFIVSTKAEEARQYLADGIREGDFSRFPEAYANMEQAIAADPNFALAEVLAGVFAPNTEAAVAHNARANALLSQANEYERLMAESNIKLFNGDIDGAVKTGEELTQKYATNARAWWSLGYLYYPGRIQDARNAMQKAIDADPNFAPGYMVLAEWNTLNEPFDYTKAEQLLRKAIELEPTESYTHDLLGDVFRARGELEKAAAEYTTAAELDPTVGGPLQQRAHVNTFLRRFAEARADYDAAVGIEKGNSKAGYLLYRPLVSIFEGNARAGVEEMLAVCAGIDTMDIPDPQQTKFAGLRPAVVMADQSGLPELAEKGLVQLREITKQRAASIQDETTRRNDQVQLLFSEGLHAAFTGDLAKAEADAREMIKLRENVQSPNKNWDAEHLLAQVALRRGQYAEVLVHVDKANSSDPYNWFLRAQALEKMGKPAEAKKEYARVATHYFNNPFIAALRKEAEAKAKA